MQLRINLSSPWCSHWFVNASNYVRTDFIVSRQHPDSLLKDSFIVKEGDNEHHDKAERCTHIFFAIIGIFRTMAN